MEKPIEINTTSIPASSQECVITLELVTEEGEDDPALINAVGHEVVGKLQQEGYTTRSPVYTGQKGGFLVEFVTFTQQIAIAAWNNHAAIAEGIADLSGLVTIFTSILPMLKRMRQTHEQQVGQQESSVHPIKITVEIDGIPLVIEASDIIQADVVLKLALKYRSAHPVAATQVTAKSKVKVQGKLPARKRRKRR